MSSMKSSLNVQKTAALKVPILPHTSPEANQPPKLKLPLHPHQLRALHRCLLIEQDGSLSGNFGVKYEYKSRGGCLADAVGMGKTATSIGLVLAADRGNGGDTLVVAPGHLILQWKTEIEKFSDDIEVLVGKTEFEARSTLLPEKSHRIVLMDVDTILKEKKLYYDWRRVFADDNGTRGRQRTFDRQTMETYKKAALFCVQSPRGPCSYEGWVYTGNLHIPLRPWRRVIFDEIQDLVSEGTQSQKNLLQLSRTAQNVWLLSATPFPHGNQSVYANHELLGFCRLRLDVEVDWSLSYDHPFENIKRKLYIRSPKHVADGAVIAKKMVSKETIYVDATKLERKFFDLEKNDIVDGRDYIFSEGYASLRQMMVHPEASKKLREQISGNDKDKGKGRKNDRGVGRYTSVNSFARSSLAQAKSRLNDITMEMPQAEKEIGYSRLSVNLARKILMKRNEPVQNNPFGSKNVTTSNKITSEADAIHEYFCRCPRYGHLHCQSDEKATFRTMSTYPNQQNIIRGANSTQLIIDYFRSDLEPGKMWESSNLESLPLYITSADRGIKIRVKTYKDLETEKATLKKKIEALEETVVVGNDRGSSGEDDLAARHGSKSAALIRHLRKIQESGEKTIVFSYWHDTLSLVWKSLKQCQLSSSFCNGTSQAMSQAITDFTSGNVSILLLSAQAKASGANLQCATNVVLLDPAGSSAEHGTTLEQQAVGRAVRMGQENAVKVTRFCVRDTIEETLFQEIDEAASKLEIRSNDNSYTCEDANKALKERKVTNEDENTVEVAKSISVTERLSRSLAEAEAKGEIINLEDSDDEDNEEAKKPASPSVGTETVRSFYASSPIAVKSEFQRKSNGIAIEQELCLSPSHGKRLISEETESRKVPRISP